MDVLEAGKMDFNGQDSYWVKFETVENDHTILNVVKYIKSDQKNEIYLIQSSVNKTGNFDENICILKLLADSFELVE
jgi:CRISPR/Cas system CMR-associated protein Cmr3 (group 5 of RAMP superfamily)